MRRCPGATTALATLLLLAGACESRPEAPTLPADAFSFGVFGDAPYSRFDIPKYRAVLGAVNASDVSLLLHVGDLLSGSCEDAVLEARARELRALRPAVVYTPGDNEWTDCHRKSSGEYRPLERLAFLRSRFFTAPERSLGASPIAVESQGREAGWDEMVENRRWRVGSIVFATLHLVGSGNGTADFRGRSPADDSAAARRMEAALAWLDDAYRLADSTRAPAVVLAFHANIGFGSRRGVRDGYEQFVPRLRERAASFGGSTLLIHGDTHDFHHDQPLTDSLGATIPRVWRIETPGSPTVGWVRVVMDSVRGTLLAVEPRHPPAWQVF